MTVGRCRRMLIAGLVAATAWSPACHPRAARSPAGLRDAHRAALEADDPAAAYALLSDDVRAVTSFEDYEARWHRDQAERSAAIAAGDDLDPALAGPIYGGTTTHDGGRVLHWTQVGDQLQVTAGLPGRPDTSTPAQTIRTFIAAVRTADLTGVRAMLGESLLEATREDWDARIDAIEAALEEPGSIDLSADLRRAELRYETGRVLMLEQTPQGWRITALR